MSAVVAVLDRFARSVVELPARWLSDHADAIDEPWEPFLDDDLDDR